MYKKSLLSAFLTAILIGLVLASAMCFGTVRASIDVSGIPKPSIPEFTLELVDSSYDVPTTYSIDPYTGENVTHEGHHVENRSIEVRIKNQPFTPVLVQVGTSTWTAYLYYNVRIKGHYSENWINRYLVGGTGGDAFPTASNSEYTVLSFPVTSSSSAQSGDVVHYDLRREIPSNAQIDFQVQAMIGFVSRTVEFASWHFTGEESGWSNTQTITIGESQTPTPSPATSPTPTPTPTITPYQEPQQIEQEIIIGVAIAVAVIGVGLGLLIYLIKRK